MPRHATVLLSLLLAVGLHIDWHLARPLHHRLSLDWPYHWAPTAALFAIAGCIIARFWPDHRWRLGTVVFASAAIVAQLVEPVLEALIYTHRLGYDVEAARWAAFGKSLLASAIAFGSTLVVCAPRRSASAS